MTINIWLTGITRCRICGLLGKILQLKSIIPSFDVNVTSGLSKQRGSSHLSPLFWHFFTSLTWTRPELRYGWEQVKILHLDKTQTVWHFHRNVVLSVWFYKLKRAEAAWIRSDSVPFPSWVKNPYCHVIFDMHPAWFCPRGAAWDRGRGTTVREQPSPPTVPFNGWIRSNIKNHSWLDVLSFLVQRLVLQRDKWTRLSCQTKCLFSYF